MAAAAGEADETAGAEEAVGGASRRGLPRLAVIGAAAVLLVGLAGGSYYAFFAGSAADGQAALPAPVPPTFLDLPELLVNLSTTGSERTQYLKVRAVLELADPSLAPQVQPFLPRIIDAFQVFLRELRPADLEGSAGIYRLREELTRRVNASIAPLKVNAVLFREMVVQ